jgi:hypothetical protein
MAADPHKLDAPFGDQTADESRLGIEPFGRRLDRQQLLRDRRRPDVLAHAALPVAERSSGGTPSARRRAWSSAVGGVFADAVLAGVHRRGDPGGVAAAFRVGDAGELR